MSLSRGPGAVDIAVVVRSRRQRADPGARLHVEYVVPEHRIREIGSDDVTPEIAAKVVEHIVVHLQPVGRLYAIVQSPIVH